MPISRSRTTRREGIKPSSDSRLVDAGGAESWPAQSGSVTASRESEWKTERWKVLVEAEARNRLKKSIRQVGSER